MNDQSLILGELKEFKRATLEELRHIKRDVHELKNFKWRIVGGATMACALATAAFQVITYLIKP